MIYASYLRGDFQESKCQIGFVNYHQFYGDFTVTCRKESPINGDFYWPYSTPREAWCVLVSHCILSSLVTAQQMKNRRKTAQHN